MSDGGDLGFLGRLGDPGAAEAAWDEFLRRFSHVVLAAARRLAGSEDDALDLHQDVCERLFADGGARLRAFRGRGADEFARWLAAVARNLCIDRLRAVHGRRRLPAAVLRLTPLAQELFQALYWEGESRAEACARARGQRPELGEAELAEALAAVEQSLRPWQLAEIFHAERPGGAEISLAGLERAPDPAAADPELGAIEGQRAAILRELVADLSPADQLLLRLRFDEGLTLGQAAGAAGIGDSRRAHEQIARILTALRERLAERGVA